jgi:hypothetical protein
MQELADCTRLMSYEPNNIIRQQHQTIRQALSLARTATDHTVGLHSCIMDQGLEM